MNLLNQVVSYNIDMNCVRCARHLGFLNGMNPMISSRNCTLQQSSVDCRDQCVHRECHCKIYRQVCMSFICMFVVLHYNSGWLSADTLQAVDLGLTLSQTDRSAQSM